MIIGLTGPAGSGKDAVADVFQDWYGYQRLAFADQIRDGLRRLDPVVGHCEGRSIRYQDAIHLFGYRGAKDHPIIGAEFRRLMQEFGTAIGRQLGEDYWIEQLSLRVNWKAADPCVVIPDVRFPNESQWIRAYGGKVLRVQRPGVGPCNGHESEQPLPDDMVSGVLDNSGSLADLRTAVVEWYVQQ